MNMANIAVLTASNPVFCARLNASNENERLSSRDEAAKILSIDPSRLYRIERGVTTPTPDEIHMMADRYRAPELEKYYCKNCCPLGCSLPETKVQDLDRISLKALSIFRRISETQDRLLDIAEDGKVTEDEKEDMQEVLRNLEELEAVAQNLKLWVAKNQKQKGGVSP